MIEILVIIAWFAIGATVVVLSRYIIRSMTVLGIMFTDWWYQRHKYNDRGRP